MQLIVTHNSSNNALANFTIIVLYYFSYIGTVSLKWTK